MDTKYIYALDLSLNSTGICIFSTDGKFITTYTIDTNKEKETKIKLKIIGNELLKISNKYTPEKIIIEQGFSLYNKSTQAIFRVHGLVNYLFSDYEQIYYPASTVKKTISGKGNINKKDLQNIIKKQHPEIEFKNFDESDAFAIGRTYFIKNNIH